MTSLPLPSVPGKLAENVAHFARALRAAGLPIGPARVVAAAEAAAAAGMGSREDLYWSLRAALTSKPDQQAVFDATFALFWRDPQIMEKLMAAMLPQARSAADHKPKAGEQRAASALMQGAKATPPPPQREDDKLEFDAAFTFSAAEKLKTMDFEQMTNDEAAQAARMIARLFLPVDPPPSRRLAPNPRGRRPDWRATLRAMLRDEGEAPEFKRRDITTRAPALVALCDISGSMSQYARMMLHFLHAAANAPRRAPGRAGLSGWSEVHAFTFGTRLTNITRHLRAKDADAALAAAGVAAQDWQGGTRIGACLHEFNRLWARRLLARGAVVLLITDGLDRETPELLGEEAARLGRLARRLIWLNPLLRWDGFQPKAQGVRALLPHVDCFRSAHNIASLEGLAEALAKPMDMGEKARMMRLMRI